MLRLVLSDEAKDDLRQLFTAEPRAARVIAALLEQAGTDQRLLESFSIQDYGAYHTEQINVVQLVHHQRQGRNIWRLKDWGLEDIGLKYRIVYALDSFSSRYHILGICKRGDLGNYKDSPAARRIMAAYNRLGIRDITARR